jgi:hypothetical protein
MVSFHSFFSFAVLAIAFVVFILISCEKVEKPVYDNPIDPLNENFVLPQAIITNSINQGSVLSETAITFLWDGVSSNNSYSYMLEGIDDTYSAWQSGVNTITYSYLDEGNYTFFVKERYNAEIVQGTPDLLAFTIDAITNCAILLRRWKTDALTGETFSLYLDIENVSKLKGLTTVIEFPSGNCTLQSVEQVDNSIDGADGMLFITTPVGEANSSGKIEINAISLDSGTGFTGNATICKLDFLSNSSSEYSIDISNSNSELRDIDNNPVTVDMVRGAVVNATGK